MRSGAAPAPARPTSPDRRTLLRRPPRRSASTDRPVAPDTPLNFEVSNEQAVQTITRTIHYAADLPTITGIDKNEGETNTPDLEVEIVGSHFIPGRTRVLVSGNGVRVPDESVEVLGANKLKAKIRIDKDAKPDERKITVTNPSGESKQTLPFTIVSPEP